MIGGVTVPVPFVPSYFTDDVEANRAFYGGFLGLRLHTEPGLEAEFFLAGSEQVRIQILRGPAAFAEIGGAPVVPSSGLIMFGVESGEELDALRQRAAACGVQESVPLSGDVGSVARFLDPDGRLVIIQRFRPDARFHAG
jgi:catechol 2,3-dioxygenase-like lactoylglutathione lyase family enzyme